ncbi:MAG TPA: hypothetical protein GX730_02580 [Chloroflexi bacterium]|nr:hypothetical protein [Chloroflexota bacterium]
MSCSILITECPIRLTILHYEGLDGWIRRRLRQMIWKRWKRGTTRYKELVKLGVPKWYEQEGSSQSVL